MSTMELDEAMTRTDRSVAAGPAALVDAAPAVDAPAVVGPAADAPAPVATVAESASTASPSARPTDPDLRTYRGKTLEELLPKIREQLGPDAIVVRQRDGLMGGIGGFFQQQFVEVDARAGHPRIDVYDEPPEPAADGFAALLAAAEENAEPTVEARPELPAPAAEPAAPPTRAPAVLDALAESVREAAQSAPPRPARARRSAPATPPAQRTPRPKATPRKVAAGASPDAIASALTQRGLGQQLASQLVADAAMHELPFAAGDLRAATIRTLTRRIPVPPPRRAAGMAVAFVGPVGAGRTHCAAALAAAYAQAGSTVVCIALGSKDAGSELTHLMAPHDVVVHAVASAAGARTQLGRAPKDALVVLDMPAVSPTDRAAIVELAEQLASFGLDETQLVVPATLDADAALELHDRLVALRPTGMALTHADDGELGAAVELACTTRLPLAYLATADAIAPADPTAVAERLLP